MSSLNFETGHQTVSALNKVIEGDIKVDPMFGAAVQSMEHAINELAAQTEKENATDMEEVMGYVREKFEFHSGELEEALAWAKDNFYRFHTQSIKDNPPNSKETALFLNALSIISDAIVNVGIQNPMGFPEDPDLTTINAYFKLVCVRTEFQETFLDPYSAHVQMRAIYENVPNSDEFNNIRQPVLVIEHEAKEYDFTIVPSRTYMPDWYLLFVSFYQKADELIQDARIAMEDIDVTTLEEVLEDSKE